MKKGNYFPKVRARWVEGLYPVQNQNLPTWCRPSSLFATILIDIGGFPFPAEVHEFDCDPASWSYVPSQGGVIWIGYFNTGLISGQWAYKQTIDNTWWSYNIFTLTHDDGMLNPRVQYDSANEFVEGVWPAHLPRNPLCIHRRPGVTPWAFMILDGMEPLSYADIRTWGANPDDTAPFTWIASGEP